MSKYETRYVARLVLISDLLSTWLGDSRANRGGNLGWSFGTYKKILQT